MQSSINNQDSKLQFDTFGELKKYICGMELDDFSEIQSITKGDTLYAFLLLEASETPIMGMARVAMESVDGASDCLLCFLTDSGFKAVGLAHLEN